MNVNFVFIFLIPCILVLAQGKTLLVSDIDDTIKISHVLDKSEMVKNALRVSNHFYGMSQVYSAYFESDNSTQFAYLSAAPEKIMSKYHLEFLRINQFPTGTLLLRETMHTHVFKLSAIRELIDLHKPDKIILIGDNGERDPFIYGQIQNEYSHIPIAVYIHQVYSHLNSEETGVPPQSNQHLFVTSLDLANLFRQHGFLSQSLFEKLVEKLGPQILTQDLKRKTGTIAFPAWIDCRDALNISSVTNNRRTLKLSRNKLAKLSTKEILDLYNYIRIARCKSGPYND